MFFISVAVIGSFWVRHHAFVGRLHEYTDYAVGESLYVGVYSWLWLIPAARVVGRLTPPPAERERDE